MNFEQALRLLAEKEPEKYAIWTRKSLGVDEFVLLSSNDCFRLDTINNANFTQDDIDAILAEMGWELHIVWHARTGGKSLWMFVAWDANDHEICPEEFLPVISKLDAAKAALIAVVEKVYGEQGK